MDRTIFRFFFFLIVGVLASTQLLMAQENETEDLAKKAQNPIGDLISLPFQNNTSFNLGPDKDRTQNVLNIQPVMPFHLRVREKIISHKIWLTVL